MYINYNSMKKIAAPLLLSLLISLKLFSQDTIIKFNGDKIIAKVLELSDTEIKYKRFEMPDGPTYRELKSEIQIIKYAGGLTEHFAPQEIRKEEVQIQKPEPARSSNEILDLGKHYVYKDGTITEQEMQTILIATKDKKLFELVQKSQQAKNLTNLGFATIPFGIAATIAIPYWINYAFCYNNSDNPYYTKENRNKYGVIAAFCFVGTIAFPIVSNVNATKRKYYNKKAIELYNQKY